MDRRESAGLTLPSHPSPSDHQRKTEALHDEEPDGHEQETYRVTIVREDMQPMNDSTHHGVETEELNRHAQESPQRVLHGYT
jgi:hypothetical protein